MPRKISTVDTKDLNMQTIRANSGKGQTSDPTAVTSVESLISQMKESDSTITGIQYDTPVDGVLKVQMVLGIGAAMSIDLDAWIAAGRPEHTRPTHKVKLNHNDRGSFKTFYFRKEVFEDVLAAHGEKLNVEMFDIEFRSICARLLPNDGKYSRNVSLNFEKPFDIAARWPRTYSFEVGRGDASKEKPGPFFNLRHEPIEAGEQLPFKLEEIRESKGISIDTDTLDLRVEITFGAYVLRNGNRSPIAVIQAGNVNIQFDTLKFIGDAELDANYVDAPKTLIWFRSEIEKHIRQYGTLNSGHGIAVDLSEATFKFL